MNRLFAPHALLPTGWARDVVVAWDDAGTLTVVERDAAPPDAAHAIAGPLIPGMPNLHSHAFQRGMAGLAEYRGPGDDDFWSWRHRMYAFAARLDPATLAGLAYGLYVDMLEAGYTAVCEFHYVHHDVDGRPYADDATLARVLLAAARRAGIGITLLPVLYQTGGFGDRPPHDGQRRFVRSTDAMLRLIDTLRADADDANTRLGFAPHSLRAVPPDALRAALDGLAAIDATAPVHIHIAEQAREVDDCVAWCGRRPVAWLLDHAAVDARWCLVHATHMDDDEARRAAATGAVAGLCPTTEANLGDGLFDLARWRRGGGAWGVGSDSHVCVDAAEELMLLEYGQRLATRARNVTVDPADRANGGDVATAMTLAAVDGGSRAAGRAIGGIAVGQRADFMVLDAGHRALAGLAPNDMLSAHVFASDRTRAIDAVWVGGRPCVEAGRHRDRESAARGFVAARRALLEGSTR